MEGLDNIEADIQNFDVSAMKNSFRIAKHALLNEHEKVSTMLELHIGEIPSEALEQWPLFIQYRESENYKEYKQNHPEIFEMLDFQPEYEKIEDEEEILEEYGVEMDNI